MLPNDHHEPTRPAAVRDAVFHLLAVNKVPIGTSDQALRQCLGFLSDVRQVHAVAGDLNLELSGFRRDEAMELYFDISHQGRDIGFLYKGWGDPGFGVGETLEIPSGNMCLLWAQEMQIKNALASNSIVATTSPTQEGGCFLEMTTPIYADQLTVNALAGALDSIMNATRDIRVIVS